ncbi:hypothetical protein [Halarchaeum sp. P4]|uniref:hypothetical protein n=1 Tax=Halarchaeum sp. P4 TaxID=3421639 RepID=UPI003EB6BBF8
MDCPARHALLWCVLLVAGLGVAAAPAAAADQPDPVSGFAGGFEGGTYRPGNYSYAGSAVTNVSVDVAVYANGTSVWTERATLVNDETATVFRENPGVYETIVQQRFDRRLGHDTHDLSSRVVNDTVVATYRIDDAASRTRGAVLFAPFDRHVADLAPMQADVTIHAPEGYRIVDHPGVMASTGTSLRWNRSTGPGNATVASGLMTFAPADASNPTFAAELAILAAYGLPSLGVGTGWALVYGLPVGYAVGGLLRLMRNRRHDGIDVTAGQRQTVRRVSLTVVILVGAVGTVLFYPATTTVVGRLFHPATIIVAMMGAALIVPIALYLHHASGRYER